MNLKTFAAAVAVGLLTAGSVGLRAGQGHDRHRHADQDVCSLDR